MLMREFIQKNKVTMEKLKVPRILEKYSKQLIEQQKEFISIKAEVIEANLDNDPLDLLDSKFLGRPFIPEGVSYPTDANGSPMILIAQINFSQMPKLDGFPHEGIMQLYFGASDWWRMEGLEKILYFDAEQLQHPLSKDYPQIPLALYEDLPIWKIHKLHFKKDIDTGNSEDCQFSIAFDNQDYWEFEEQLDESQKQIFSDYFNGEGHKIGGYAYFTQGDPRDYNIEQQDDIQLLQIDTDDEIMFGDSGIGHIFISPNDLRTKSIEKAYFYWDCC